jgi:hypothetical protein
MRAESEELLDSDDQPSKRAKYTEEEAPLLAYSEARSRR